MRFFDSTLYPLHRPLSHHQQMEISEQIALRLFGWKWYTHPDLTCMVFPPDRAPSSEWKVGRISMTRHREWDKHLRQSNFAGDMAMALRVIQRYDSRLFCWSIATTRVADDSRVDCPRYECVLEQPRRPGYNTDTPQKFVGLAYDQPAAICFAALAFETRNDPPPPITRFAPATTRAIDFER